MVYVKRTRKLFPYRMGICAIVFNEGQYLQEWIEYHKMLGFEKFYIYDNESDDNTKEILKPYIINGTVEYKFYPGKVVQMEAYRECISKHRFDCQWLCALDLDEFIYPINEKNLYDYLTELSKEDEKMGALAMQWNTYGNGGHESKPQGGVVDNYLYRADYNIRSGNWSSNIVKCIFNPRMVIPYTSGVHRFLLFKGLYTVNEKGQVVINRYTNTYDEPREICVNHYITKSREEWIKRRSHKTADGANQRVIDDFDKWNKYLNDKLDDRLSLYRKKLIGKTNVSASSDNEICLESDTERKEIGTEKLIAFIYIYGEKEDVNYEVTDLLTLAKQMLHERIKNDEVQLHEIEFLYSVIREESVMEEYMNDIRLFLTNKTINKKIERV